MNELLKELADNMTKAQALLADAEDVQWESPPNPISQDEVGIRGTGGIPADTTSSIAMDLRRLRLREQVVATQRAIKAAAVEIEKQTYLINKALEAWQG